MITPPHDARPHWLPLRLALGGAAMAGLYFLLHGGSILDTVRLLLGLDPRANGEPPSAAAVSLSACAGTIAVLSLAMTTAFATAFATVTAVRRLCPALLVLLPLAGRLLFAAPVFGVLWILAGWWIGDHGGVIETLMPPRPLGIGEPAHEVFARHIWTLLAPVLVLALPLSGLLIDRLAGSLHSAPYSALETGLRARGLPPGWILDRHLLPLLWPAWHRALESSLFAAIILDVVVETALQFPGWGAAFSAALNNGHYHAAAASLYAGGWILAVLCGALWLLRPKIQVKTPIRLTRPSASFLPASAAALCIAAALGLLFLDSPLNAGRSTLPGGANCLPAWQNDAAACLQILAFALVGGTMLAALRFTILGDWLRRYGSLETLVWSPLALWVPAWSLASGFVITIDQALALAAAIHVSIHLHASVRRQNASLLLQSAQALGASAWQAWTRHALRPWLRDLTAYGCGLAASVWWLRVLIHCLLPPDKTDPSASLGVFLSHASTEALLRSTPLLSASLAATVSVLFFWALSRIIPSPRPDDT